MRCQPHPCPWQTSTSADTQSLGAQEVPISRFSVFTESTEALRNPCFFFFFFKTPAALAAFQELFVWF